MKKIPTLYRRDHNTSLVVDEVTPGCEWVLGAGVVATEKIDGTCCRIFDGKLWKRYDRKPAKKHRKRRAEALEYGVEHAHLAPAGWEACQSAPDVVTGHWPGWLPVDFEAPEDRWHAEAWEELERLEMEGLSGAKALGATCELIGPKVQGNPYGLDRHELVAHGAKCIGFDFAYEGSSPSASSKVLRGFLEEAGIEGLVFYSSKHWGDSDWMVKIKASDFGIDWIKGSAGKRTPRRTPWRVCDIELAPLEWIE